MADLKRQIKDLEKKLNQYSRTDVPRAVASSLNRGVGRVKSQVVRTVAKEVRLPAKFLRNKVYTSRAKTSGLKAYVRSYLTPISAARLLSTATLLKRRGTGTNRRGVRVAGQQIDGAFINIGRKDGYFHVLRRKGTERYPLEKVSIKIEPSMMQNQLPIADRFMRSDFERELIRQLNFRLSKYVR